MSDDMIVVSISLETSEVQDIIDALNLKSSSLIELKNKIYNNANAQIITAKATYEEQLKKDLEESEKINKKEEKIANGKQKY